MIIDFYNWRSASGRAECEGTISCGSELHCNFHAVIVFVQLQRGLLEKKALVENGSVHLHAFLTYLSRPASSLIPCNLTSGLMLFWRGPLTFVFTTWTSPIPDISLVSSAPRTSHSVASMMAESRSLLTEYMLRAWKERRGRRWRYSSALANMATKQASP